MCKDVNTESIIIRPLIFHGISGIFKIPRYELRKLIEVLIQKINTVKPLTLANACLIEDDTYISICSKSVRGAACIAYKKN